MSDLITTGKYSNIVSHMFTEVKKGLIILQYTGCNNTLMMSCVMADYSRFYRTCPSIKQKADI